MLEYVNGPRTSSLSKYYPEGDGSESTWSPSHIGDFRHPLFDSASDELPGDIRSRRLYRPRNDGRLSQAVRRALLSIPAIRYIPAKSYFAPPKQQNPVINPRPARDTNGEPLRLITGFNWQQKTVRNVLAGHPYYSRCAPEMEVC
jgi:hypothetical protein